KEISSQDPSSESTQPAPSKERSPPPQQRVDAQDSSKTQPAVPSIDDEPEHPFRDARDANYLPPQHRNVAAPPKPALKKAEPAYRNQAPIHDDSIANNIFNRSLDAPITLTQRELLSIAPDVRTQYKDVTTAKRNVTSGATVQTHLLEASPAPDRVYNVFTASSTTSAVPSSMHRSPPEGATVIPDQYDQYYRSLRPGEKPDPNRLYVSKESAALRSIFPIVDNSQKIECILDPGSQIIAMSEEVCHELSLIYDPTVKLNMQSANGTVDQSLGLARNVPFRIGSIVLYMQVHIIRAPAYDILLGRPFDILTESVVRNFRNEDQTITVTDPNTNQT
ncbi:hypothetical protein CPC08DRAFT_607474, partial [Agrocybe pediades]